MGHIGSQSNNGGNKSSTIDVDTALRVLANPICRYSLRQLIAEPSHTLSIDDLANSYAKDANLHREAIIIKCRHSHIPALEAADIIDFDEQSGDVRYYPDPFIEAILDVLDQWEE